MQERLQRQVITVDYEPRALERLILVLARRANARVTMRYRLSPAPAGETPRRGASALATSLVSLEIPKPVALAQVLQQLGIRTEIAEGVSGQVRVSAARRPLSQVLDQIASQVDANWQTVLRFETRGAVDAAAAEDDRRQFFYGDLAQLAPRERQAELAVDLESLHALPSEQRASETQRLAASILWMAALVKQTPGEHRQPVVATVQAILMDYRAALARLPADRQAEIAPLSRALQEVPGLLAQIH